VFCDPAVGRAYGADETLTEFMSELLHANGIVKRFGSFTALKGVTFRLRAGEIHALMGENGAGKSTLIKVLTGVHEADGGTVTVAGRGIRAASPREAEAAGISTVYQEVNLLPNLSVAENILMGRQPMRGPFIRHGEVKRRARAALARLGLEVDVGALLGSFPVAVQQMTAIARALDQEARVLILDEPTSSLDARESEELFAVMRRLRDEGMGIVFVSHFLDQIYAVSDRITVLRDGSLVGTWEAAGLPRLELVSHMIGKEVTASSGDGGVVSGGGAEAFRVEGLERKGTVGPLTFSVAAGEATGLAGLLGSGRTETARMLFGIDAATGGRVVAGGEAVDLGSPRAAMAAGLAFCSEDRKVEGIIPSLSVRENIVLAMQASRGVLRRVPRAEQEALAAKFIAALNIRTRGPETPIGTLSGGNQQKCLLARWMAMQPRLLILDEPTRGIDVGAKAEIEALCGELRRAGMSILFISAELEEVVRNCSRVVVLRDRRQAAVLDGPAISLRTIMETVAAS
jgi:simple sugar transport system ATP-binding protein